MLFYLDGSNICRWNKQHIFSLPILLNLCVALKNKGDDFVCYFDANVRALLRDKKDELEALEILLKNTLTYRVAPTGTQVNGFIVMSAENDNASIISNDRFRNLSHKHPWVEGRGVDERLFRGMVTYSKTHDCDFLIIPNLSINILIKTKLMLLTQELI